MAGKNSHKSALNPWVYDFILWSWSIAIDLFFREVHPRGSWRIPRTGPVIFVGAPHANQFVDPLILARLIRNEARRRVAFLIAEKSMKRKWIGAFASMMGAVSVGRALDSTKSMPGRVYLPDPDNEPTLLRGKGTDFEKPDFQVGGLIVLPSVNNVAANAEIVEILGPEELRVKKPFGSEIAMQQLTGRRPQSQEFLDEKTQAQIAKGRKEDGVTFKVAPKVDQTQVYDKVYSLLHSGGCIGIYPEGGSHDRTELLPLKAGVAIMALGAMEKDPSCGLKIVPCGMNYFHAHKFRSRAVIEFGSPIEVPPELVELYRNGHRREAIGAMLEHVYDALVGVTVTSPDYDTLMLIQAVRRLYNPKGKRLPLPMVVELNRRLVKGYTRYKDDPRIVNLKKNVTAYNKALLALNIRDHQLEYARLPWYKVIWYLISRTFRLIFFALGVLPGVILFAPIFIAGKLISIRKSREALAASSVKIQAKDVVATWKLLVAVALAPALYIWDIILLIIWTYYNRIQGLVPLWVPLWTIVPIGMVIFPSMCIAALRFGEIGMDIVKSLRPLLLALNPGTSNSLVSLRLRRKALAHEVTELINELGPEIFPDFDAQRLISEEGSYSPRGRQMEYKFRVSDVDGEETAEMLPTGTAGASIGGGSSAKGDLPKNDSFRNLSSFGFFASRPTTPTHSRGQSRSHSRPGSSGGGFLGMTGLSPLSSTKASEDVNLKIRKAMKERGQGRSHGGDESPSAELVADADSNGHGALDDKKDV